MITNKKGADPHGPRARTLAAVYRAFGEDDGTSPLYRRIALALSASDEALRAIEQAPVRRRQPALILAALHDLALSGQAPELAEIYTAPVGHVAPDHDDPDDPDDHVRPTPESHPRQPDPAAVAVGTLLRQSAAVAAIAAARRVRTLQTARCAVLYPAAAEAAHRAGATAVALIDMDCSTGLNLQVDQCGIAYDNGQVRGDTLSPVQLSARIVGDRPLPERAFPEVVTRIGIDPDPLDLSAGARPGTGSHTGIDARSDPDDARWLHACLAPDRPGQAADLRAQLTLAARTKPHLLRGEALDLLPDALAQVPTGVLPIVTTTWALSRHRPEKRRRFRQLLEEAGRPVAWVSAEGVGVAPGIPTFGDRPASGHSIVGLALFGSSPHSEALGRCWSRGRLLSWTAG
ncbi:DUF2332 domain-containing protein [Kineosporia sp. NBRC 101731]|uniref:DUF2332 domain-containing protein n=1 Tax=Kineosporia sp. NBRC 101731 TaxID=3032199 RepID=UPI0024A2E125|nr:DUF2332 domain-containing protein [Kineosporia sp. NBRC 101731]GLY29161.1 hypothetical protein Kisp02_25260 [Kineosporia sp. NBRC 101731]